MMFEILILIMLGVSLYCLTKYHDGGVYGFGCNPIALKKIKEAQLKQKLIEDEKDEERRKVYSSKLDIEKENERKIQNLKNHKNAGIDIEEGFE